MCELCLSRGLRDPSEAGWLEPAAVSPYGAGRASDVPTTGNATVDSLLAGSKWGGGLGQGATIEFSFARYGSTWAGDYGDGEPDSGFRPLNAQQHAAALKALQLWADVARIDFVEVQETASKVGDIRFGLSNVPATAWAYYPTDEYPEGGDVWLGAASHLGQTDYRDGTYYFHTVMHEIGHALGLKHPHDPDGAGVTSSSDWLGVSAMSYRSYAGDGVSGAYSNDFFPTSPMLWDISAIQALYGANYATRAGNTTYQWGNGEQIFECLWDGGGRDVIDCSNQSSAVTISLVAGSWSRIGPAYTWYDFREGSTPNTLSIARGVTIEDAKGGGAADTLLGNAAANRLEGNAGADLLSGNDGADSLDGGAGIDRLTGGRGADRFVFDDGDSGIGSRRDVVTDFSYAGGDRIDLHLIDANLGVGGDQAFQWKAGAALSGAAQVGFYRSGGATIIRASTDGDSAAEIEIQLNGQVTPTSDWFLL